MSSDELQEKIGKLPIWAKAHIRFLQGRTEDNLLIAEIVQLRKEVARLKVDARTQQDRISAMVEFFRCAARGEHEVAQAVQKIVEDFLSTNEE